MVYPALEWKRNLVAHGDAREEKWRGKRRMEWVASSLQFHSEQSIQCYYNRSPPTRTPKKPVLDWTDTPADINGLVLFRWKTESGFCACAITFRFHSTTADVHTSATSSRLNWRPPADLNGLVRFAERRNLVSSRVPSHFNWPLRTVNSNSRTSNWQCNPFSKKHPIVRIFCLSGWLTVPLNPDNWSCYSMFCSQRINTNLLHPVIYLLVRSSTLWKSLWRWNIVRTKHVGELTNKTIIQCNKMVFESLWMDFVIFE